MAVYCVIEEMDTDRGIVTSVIAVFDDEEKANSLIDLLEADGVQEMYKYPTSWWVDDHVVNEPSDNVAPVDFSHLISPCEEEV